MVTCKINEFLLYHYHALIFEFCVDMYIGVTEFRSKASLQVEASTFEEGQGKNNMKVIQTCTFKALQANTLLT